MALPSLLISSLNGILSGFSEKYVLVLGVYYKLQTFIYLSANGIIQGIRPLIGYNYGAGEKKRVEKIFRTALGLVLGVMAAGMLISWLIPGKLIGLFTVNEETIRIGITALHIISFGFIVSGVSVTCSGALEGLGKGTPSFCIAVAAICHCHYSGSISVWKNTGSKRRMAGISGGRGIDSGVCNHTISEVR